MMYSQKQEQSKVREAFAPEEGKHSRARGVFNIYTPLFEWNVCNLGTTWTVFLIATKQKSLAIFWLRGFLFCRGRVIRTLDLLPPKQAR